MKSADFTTTIIRFLSFDFVVCLTVLVLFALKNMWAVRNKFGFLSPAIVRLIGNTVWSTSNFFNWKL